MAFDPYASARVLFKQGTTPTHVVTAEDRDRLQSYDLYENVYWTQPDAFQIMQRGQDTQPIYLPSARKMIEASNRFFAVDFGYIINAETEDEKLAVGALINKIFRRETFFTKFSSQKRYGLIRGDALWHIVADEAKGAAGSGQRISIFELDPRNYFPIFDPDNIDVQVGCHLVDVIVDPNDKNKTKKIVRRQTYRKEDGGITSELKFFQVDKWDDRNIAEKDLKEVHTGFEVVKKTLPAAITKLPVYKVPNNRIPGKIFGFSEVMGIERVMGAVNQAVSDEELTLAMAGLGVFFTTSGPPKNDLGDIIPWEIGPAQVVEGGKDTKFERVSGVQSVAPMIDHMQFILGETQGGLGVPDIAAGKVDVTVAESGISLILQLSPLLAKNAEKEGDLIGIYDQMFFDLVHGWLVAFEGVPATTTAQMVAVVGDPIPTNRKAKVDEILALVAGSILSIQEARAELVKLGYPLRDAEGKISVDPIVSQERELAKARAFDPFAERLLEESGTGQTGQNGNNPKIGVLPV